MVVNAAKNVAEIEARIVTIAEIVKEIEIEDEVEVEDAVEVDDVVEVEDAVDQEVELIAEEEVVAVEDSVADPEVLDVGVENGPGHVLDLDLVVVVWKSQLLDIQSLDHECPKRNLRNQTKRKDQREIKTIRKIAAVNLKTRKLL